MTITLDPDPARHAQLFDMCMRALDPFYARPAGPGRYHNLAITAARLASRGKVR